MKSAGNAQWRNNYYSVIKLVSTFQFIDAFIVVCSNVESYPQKEKNQLPLLIKNLDIALVITN